MKEEKIFNKRISGFVICFFVMLIFSSFCYAIDEKGLAIVCLILSLFQIVFILITPIYYIFSKERLIIKYCFGPEESIPWEHVREVVKNHENAFKYTPLDTYKIYYYSKKKHPFYMQGVVCKNKATTILMEKYYSKKLPR